MALPSVQHQTLLPPRRRLMMHGMLFEQLRMADERKIHFYK